jgi:iron(III) transport system ATP-binding protein
MLLTDSIAAGPLGTAGSIDRDRNDIEEPILALDRIGKYFGPVKAVDNLSLQIQKGEIFTLLGPSGCGKTTTLRQIAGLENPDEGKMFFRGKTLASPAEGLFVPPYLRNMGMVFQSYAIWPHLTVFETVAYPLRARKVSGPELTKRVTEVLELVGLKGFEDRPGPALSGGQQQRVAVARALVYQPDILLLDEPFSNLDVKLREKMRIELKLLQRRVGVTVILVTHDQVEALSLSDRIAVMNAGKIEQVGTPLGLYEKPATPFVRDFIGTSITLPAVVSDIAAGGEIKVTLTDGTNRSFSCAHSRVPDLAKGQSVAISIRPEDVVIGRDGPAGNLYEGLIDALLFVGDRFECHVLAGDTSFLVHAARSKRLQEKEKVRLHFPTEALTIWRQ